LLLDTARSGDVEVSLCQHFRYAGRLELEIATHLFSARVSLTRPEDLDRVRDFLAAHHGRATFADIVIGTLGGHPVRLVTDDEHAGRAWLRTTPAADGMFEVALDSQTIADLAAALSSLAP
jgi:hypothetical protein